MEEQEKIDGDDFIKEMEEYCKKNNISFTIDTNPSKETIERIQKSIKRREELQEMFIKRYKDKN